MTEVVIVGGGFGGLEAAREFAGVDVHVTVIDRTNHHLFQPLLYQVATATLPAPDITVPIRWVLRHRRNVEVWMAEVVSVDPARRVVCLDDGREVAFDYLILAAGARHSYFSHPEWEPLAPGLKSIADALLIRNRFLSAFESAEKADDLAERARWLTFLIVGGGPTGVELAGMVPTIAKHSLRSDYRRIDTANTRVILVEGGPRLLPTFPEDLAKQARSDLETLGVDVRTGSMVTDIGDGYVKIGDERIDVNTVLWAAGNAASPLGRTSGGKVDRAGRVLVNSDLSVPEHPNIFVVGDLAEMHSDGKPVPGVAPAAMQSGRAAARNVLHDLRHEAREKFRYHNKGDLATIGRNRAIAAIGGHHMSGPFAWWIWLLVHIMYLAGFRNRVSVLIQWAYAYLSYERGARLIIDRREEHS